MRQKKIISVFFNPIVYYPPTLHALKLLGDQNELYSLSTEKLDKELSVLANVNRYIVTRDKNRVGIIWTSYFFFRFCIKLFQLLRRTNPQVVLLYDDSALLAWYIVSMAYQKKVTLWYHNHDITGNGSVKKFSFWYFALLAQKKLFPELSIFSIPSLERLDYFPMETFQGKLFHLPNFPAKYFYQNHSILKNLESNLREVKIIYQGRVSDGHGLIEMIGYLQERKNYFLTIIGSADIEFVKKLKAKIEETNLKDRVSILPPVVYEKLIPITAQHDIGLALVLPDNINYKTSGTASNKIYEYPALGLPIIYFDDSHFNSYLSKYDWALPTDLSHDSLDECFSTIISNIEKLSQSAINDFEEGINFEKHFKAIQTYLELL